MTDRPRHLCDFGVPGLAAEFVSDGMNPLHAGKVLRHYFQDAGSTGF